MRKTKIIIKAGMWLRINNFSARLSFNFEISGKIRHSLHCIVSIWCVKNKANAVKNQKSIIDFYKTTNFNNAFHFLYNKITDY